MDWMYTIVLMAVLLGILLSAGVWIGVSLAITGFIILFVNGYGFQAVSSIYWTTTNSFIVIAIPLFIFMGQLILVSGISEKFYRSITPWARFIPGRLYSTNIVACGIFSAVSGSSTATAAALSSLAIPELRKRGYNDRLNFGTLAAGGTLGILIPPSAVMIIYGSLVNQDIAKLFLAGIVPGLLLIMIFCLYLFIICFLRKELLPSGDGIQPVDRTALRLAIPGVLPLALLMVIVIGGIYSGIVTPTEAGALGVAGALVIGFVFGSLTIGLIWESARRSVVTTSMIMFIILGAQILGYALARTETSRELVQWVVSLGLGRWHVFLIIVVIYLILGCFVEGLSIMVLSLPLVFPVIIGFGFDPIWFGVVLVMLIEVSLITPPVGLNLFVIRKYAQGKGELRDVALGSFPFVLLILLAILILCIWPQLALSLPGRL